MPMLSCTTQGSRSLRSQARPSVQPRRSVVASAAKQLSVEIEKPLGLKLKASKASGGGCVVAGINGNAAKSGLKAGDTIIYASSWFGDELWPADSPSFVNTALARAPSPVYLTYVQGDNVDYPVKRLPKKPAPARFGRRLTASQKERATHICVDCGYVYCDPLPFAETDPDYRCPQCQAPKKRFATFNPETGETGGTSQDLATLLTVVVGLAGVAAIAALGFSL